MTLDEIAKQIDAIARMAGDPENAHWAEDNLHQAVLAAIADGSAEKPAECAKLALTTLSIEFSRWYA